MGQKIEGYAVLGPERGQSVAPLTGVLGGLQDELYPLWWSNPRPDSFPDNLLPTYKAIVASREEAAIAIALAPSCVRAEVYYPQPVVDNRWWKTASIAAVGLGVMGLLAISSTETIYLSVPIAAVAMAGLCRLSR